MGAILYQLLTGQAPFRGESRADTIQQVIFLEPVPPSRLNSRVHRDLETICLKCLEKEPGNRYPTARLLSDSLRLFVNQRLEKHEYGDVTTAEISQAYAEFCADNAWNVLPTAVLERTLPDLILDAFHVPKSHSIERNGKRSNRGWHTVRLREEPAFKLQTEA